MKIYIKLDNSALSNFLGKTFLKQVLANDPINTLFYTNESGAFVGASYFNKTATITISDPLNARSYKTFEVDQAGENTQVITQKNKLHVISDAWYAKFTQPNTLYWSELLADSKGSALTMNVSKGVYSRAGKKLGVVGVDVILDDVSDFLKSLNIPKGGVIYLTETNNTLVAASTNKVIAGDNKRIAIDALNDDIVKGALKLINSKISKDNFKVKSEMFYYDVSEIPIHEKANWRLILAIPEKEFTNTLDNLFSIFKGTFVLTIFLIIFCIYITANWISNIIKKLNEEVKNISNNNWDGEIKLYNVLELDQFSISFNDLIMQLNDNILNLKTNKDKLAYLNSNLENIVELKTRELKKISRTDPLTNLYNRRFLTEILSEYALDNKAEIQMLSVAMIDVDHFKAVNDTYGHTVGDVVLVQLADYFVKALRETDLCGRYGGEEFVIILPNTTIQNAFKIIERFREEISKMTFTKHKINITISGGLSICNNIHDFDDIINESDKKMYIAKESGRNMIVYC